MKNSLKALFFATSIFLFLFDFSSCVIEPRPFYLTYESKYGIVPEKKKIPVNTVLTEKELPTLYSEDHTFKGWYEEGIKAEPNVYVVTKNAHFIANWEEIPKFEYKVKHWKQNLENDDYTLFKTETLFGKANDSTQAYSFDYEGFTSLYFDQQTIKNDNSTEVNIYYDRKIITLTFNSNGGSSVSSVIGKYGATVTKIETPIKEGYTFVDWQPTLPTTFPAQDTTYKARWILESDYLITYNLDGGENSLENPISFNIETDTIILKKPTKQGYTFTGWINEDGATVTKIPKGTTGNITLTATWTPNSNTEYIVEYYCQNIENNEYTLVDVDAKTGTTDSLTEAEIKEFVGFHTPEVEQQTINADGSTLIQIFYERKIITLTFVNEEGVVFDTLEGKYGAPITIEVPSNSDYTFVKWQETPPETFPAENQSYTAIWILTDLISTAATVADDILSLQGEGPHDIVLVGEISYETMQTIVEAMRTNVNAKVNLDLELTTSHDNNYIGTVFYDCTNLTSIKLPENTTFIYQSAFDGCSSLTSITIPKNVEFVGVCAFNRCNNLTQFIVDENNPYFSSSDDGKILFNKDKTTLVSYPSATEDITIPYGVTTIAETAFSYCENLLSVTIPNSVTYIGNEAFSSCTNLTNIIIPNSVTSIEPNTFLYCSNLTSITLPNSITSINSSAFHGCSGLESITIPNSVTSIGSHAFANCTNLTEIVLPNSVTTIENNTFEYCENLTTITLPNSITSIGSLAFYYCSKLTEISIPNGVTTIESDIFSQCYALTNVTLPDSITSINSYAFNGCTSLTNITIPNSVTSIGSYAFQSCSNLESIIIPDSVTSIGSYAFSWCNSLESIIIPNGIKTIESGIFAYCYNLSSVTIPNSVTVIGSYAFESCNSLTEIVLPNGVTTIDSGAFWNCTNLVSINIPNSVTYIGSNAFYNCKISEVTLPDTISTIGYQAYLSCYNLTTINIPASVTSIESAAFQGCTNLTTFNVDPNNQYYSSSDDKRILYNKDKTILLSYPTAEGNISLPAGVEKIEDGAFSSCMNLTQIELPNSITYIGNNAFSDCSNLTEINIPFGVTYIGDSAFSYCHALQNIELPSNVTSIGAYAFYYCSNLMNITLPQNLETIGVSAFYGCSSLTNISIPASVTTIGNQAFMYCTNLIFSIAANNEYYSNSYDGSMLLNKDKTILIAYPSASGDIVISENVTTIEDYAFNSCYNLTNIELPDSVTTIGYQAFFSCNNLKNVTLPKNLTSIESYAFAHCYSLENIIIPTKVSTIGSYAFYCCDNLQNVIFRDPTTWYYTYNSDYIYGTEIDVTDEYQNAFYLRNNYDWYWYKE